MTVADSVVEFFSLESSRETMHLFTIGCSFYVRDVG